MSTRRRVLLISVTAVLVLGAVTLGLYRSKRIPSTEQHTVASVTSAPSVPKTHLSTTSQTDSVVLPAPKPPAPVTNAVTATTPPPESSPKPSRKPIANDPRIPKHRQVLLANRRIAVETGRSFPKRFCATQTPTVRGTAPYVVISERPVNRDVRIQAMANGAKVIGFLPNNALLVEADETALKNLEDDAQFLAAVEYEPTDKLQYALLNELKGKETTDATIALFNDQDIPGIRDYISENGGTFLHGAPKGGKALSATIPIALVEKLAGKAEVKWIERYGRLKLHNDVAVQPGQMNVTPVREAPLGLTGAGQIISTSDTGIDTGDKETMHADLKKAILGFSRVHYYCYGSDKSGHGTHTAGSLVGDGTLSDGKIRGVAPGAKLWAWFCEGDDGYLYLPEYYYWQARNYLIDVDYLFLPDGVDAHVHSASWGGSNYGYYTIQECWPVDAFVWQHPDFLPVFSAGNAGTGQMTVGEPATAKNVLAVGASENHRSEKGSYADNPAQIAYFSSCGPCRDGRIKPDIVAPGTYILSCLSTQAKRCGWDDGSHTNYQYMSGTSMSCPLTAGAAALVREWLVKHQSKSNPSAALVKAILTGGATDLYYESGNNVLKSVPDTRQGWGRVDLAGTVAPTNGLATFLADYLPFAATSNFIFQVTTTNTAPLNVQLVWVDYPAESLSGKALVNDLDLRVSGNGNTWYGNGGTAPDDVNNVESVRVRSTPAGTYVIRVKCPTVPYDHTEGGAAALYIRGAFDPKRVTCDTKVGMIWTLQ